MGKIGLYIYLVSLGGILMTNVSRKRFLESCFWLALPLPAVQISSLIAHDTQQHKRINARINPEFEPGYLKMKHSGELKKRGESLWKLMESCELCPRMCAAERLDGEKGFCEASSQLEIASFHPHHGEEDALVGNGGSGTVFFTNCNLRCVFCINYDISQEGAGEQRSIEDLAAMMLKLQQIGCHNINVVTPTHYSAHIILALDLAADHGLSLPLVYNTCGWERLKILKVLDGIVDIYLPDYKYFDPIAADTYSSGADSYPQMTGDAILEMNRQVGVAKPAVDGLMYRGLMIRHLVMPNNVSRSAEIMKWIATNLPIDTYVNIMSQYRPTYKAFDYEKINRRITRAEYLTVVNTAKEAGLTNLDVQGVPFY
jgi:putative pyruvate formate lyase activating enzyme